jgi:NAD(P)-dependent dehydrogenase (short-subunit alcohol dehydrogenase family)
MGTPAGQDRAGPARPEDIAAVVAFLPGPDSGWISGQNLPADGGLLPRPLGCDP